MRVVGFPEKFWVVTAPTPQSQLGDICFQCDFSEFAQQIRGGLDVEKVVAIFAAEDEAAKLAEHLLKSTQVARGETGEDCVIHPSPWPDWFATQDSLSGVFICDKATDEKVKVEPPREWGRNWTWNITEDGTGIFMKRK